MRKITNIINQRQSFVYIFTLIAFGFVFLNFFNFVVETYNEDIKSQQIEKRREADSGKSFGFFSCNLGEPRKHTQSKLFNLLIFFLSVLLLYKITFWKTFSSLLLQLLAFAHFFFWFLDSYVWFNYLKREYSDKALAEEFAFVNLTFPFRYLEYSNYLDFVVLFCLLILIFWQVSILYCFAKEKFHDKLLLR
jgi:hypothetical protein